MQKIFQVSGPKKGKGAAMLIFDKIDFRPKLIKRDRERHCLPIKGKIHQKDIAILHMSSLRMKVPKLLKERFL